MHGLEAGVKIGGAGGGNLRERINKWIRSGKKTGVRGPTLEKEKIMD